MTNPIDGKPQKLAFTEINFGPAENARIKLNDAAVLKYSKMMKDGAEFESPLVFYDGREFWLVDGKHRCKAAQQLGRTEILCWVRPDTKEEAYLQAIAANARDKVNLTNDDKRHNVAYLLDDPKVLGENWSTRRIADYAGCSHSLVAQIIKERAAREADDCQDLQSKVESKQRASRLAERVAPSVVATEADDDEDLGEDLKETLRKEIETEYLEVRRQILAIKKGIEDKQKDPELGQNWNRCFVTKYLEQAAGCMWMYRPAEICPKCEGSGEGDQHNGRCRWCDGTGYSTYQRVRDENAGNKHLTKLAS